MDALAFFSAILDARLLFVCVFYRLHQVGVQLGFRQADTFHQCSGQPEKHD